MPKQQQNQPARRSRGRRGVSRVAIFGVVAGAIIVGVRRLLASHDASWSAHTPREERSQEPSAAPKPTDPDDSRPPTATGGYVGEQPPAGFEIKANVLSRRYHVPGSAGYERTIADVWFDTPDAARTAGFLPAGS